MVGTDAGRYPPHHPDPPPLLEAVPPVLRGVKNFWINTDDTEPSERRDARGLLGEKDSFERFPPCARIVPR